MECDNHDSRMTFDNTTRCAMQSIEVFRQRVSHLRCRVRGPRSSDSQVLGGKLSRSTGADKHTALRPLRKGDVPHTQVPRQVRRRDRGEV